MAELFGFMVAMYLVAKLSEVLLLKWFISSTSLRVLISTSLATALVIGGQMNHAAMQGREYNVTQGVFLALGGLMLLVVRLLWNRRRLRIAKVGAKQ